MDHARAEDWRPLAAIIAVSLVLALVIAAAAPLRVFENHLSDLRQSRHGRPAPASRDIVIIAVDDQTLATLPYTSPISRALLASVARELDKRGARVIAFDILFDRSSDPGADAAFTAALAASAAPVVAVADPGAAARRALCTGGDARDADENGSVIAPFRAHVATGHGVLCLNGADEVVRTTRFDEQPPAFARAILEAAGAPAPETTRLRPRFGLTEERRWIFPTYSAAHVAALPEAWIRDKIVLVGRITPYSGDWRLTPLRHAAIASAVEPAALMPEGRLPGVVVHAYAVEAALTGRSGPRAGVLAALVTGLAAAALGAALGAARAVWWAKFAGLLGLLELWWMAVFVLYAATGTLAPFSPAALAAVIAAGGALGWRERRERARRQVIHQAFQHFLAPDIVDALVRQPEGLRLEATETEITALFTDLEGFTRLIDLLPPAEVAGVLNGYLDEIVEAVMTSGGVVDKIVGDAVHALFSTPLPDADHRRTALRCALAIRQHTEAYREKLRGRGVTLGRTRIGVNSGLALVGNFGAGRRLDFTAHGSTVNIAARLEAANKSLGTQIAVSAAARADAPEFAFRTVGPVAMRGIAAPIEVFELIAPNDPAAARLAAYERAVAQIETTPQDAARALEALAARAPEDGLIAFQRARAAQACERSARAAPIAV